MQMPATLLPYALLLTGLLLMSNCKGRKDWIAGAVAIALLAWTLLESLWTIVMTLRDGLGTYSYPFTINGSFQSPAPFGALNAIGLAVAIATLVTLRKESGWPARFQRCLAWAVLVPATVVLLVSRSRAAWVGLFISLLLLLLRETGLKGWMRRHRVVAASAALIILVAGAGMYALKKDSAIGRFHLWHMECRAIAAHPWTGVGFDHIFKAYGDAQSAYFQQAERPAVFVRVADSPVYAFNEYLKFGMAWGIGGFLLSAAVAAYVVWRLFRKRSVLAYGALVYALFAFASFPLSVVQLKLLGTVLLAVALAPDGKRHPWWLQVVWGIAFCACVAAAIYAYPEEKTRRAAEREWRASLLMELDTEEALALLQPLYDYLKDNSTYLYHYGYLLRQSGAYEASNRILQQGAERSCDPVFHTTMAQNYLDLGLPELADAERQVAHWLIPSRY